MLDNNKEQLFVIREVFSVEQIVFSLWLLVSDIMLSTQ